MQVNDLVLKVAGQPVTDQADFYRKMWAIGQAGADITLTLLHETEITDITVRSSDREQYFHTAPTPQSRTPQKPSRRPRDRARPTPLLSYLL